MKALTASRIRAARALAVAADLLQVAVFPAFAPGYLSVLNDALDVAVAIALFTLVGWHWAFLPTFIVELVPLADLVPTWTGAVWIATRDRGAAPASDLTATAPGSSHPGARP